MSRFCSPSLKIALFFHWLMWEGGGGSELFGDIILLGGRGLRIWICQGERGCWVFGRWKVDLDFLVLKTSYEDVLFSSYYQPELLHEEGIKSYRI